MGVTHLVRHDDVNYRRLIGQLRAAGRSKDRRLANILARCAEADPCRSGACIYCGRDFQSVAFDLVEQELRAPARRDFRGRMSAFTVVPTAGLLAPEDSTASACRAIVAAVTTALHECSVSPYALSLDISFNENVDGIVEACAHGHGLRSNWFTIEEKASLKAAFPGSEKVKRPVRFDELDRHENGRLYSFKPDRGRRVARHDGGRPVRRTLRPWQAVALAHVEHELGFDYRLIANGIDENRAGVALNAFYRARDGPY